MGKAHGRVDPFRMALQIASFAVFLNRPICRTRMVVNQYIQDKRMLAYLLAIGVPSICTFIGNLFFPYIDSSNLIMLYLLGVVFVASVNSEFQGPAMLAALASTLAFDYFFVPPYLNFHVSDIQYFFTLLVMLIVSQTISHLTLRVHRHQAIVRKTKMRAEAEKLRNIFLTSISHDMRTPLTAIIGSASTLLQPEKINSVVQNELAKNIYDESLRLNRIINNVLQIIRLESGSIKINKNLNSMEEIIYDVVERLNTEKEERTFQLNFAKRMVLIPFDPMLIEQVLMNLLENAIKYSPNHTQIEINARCRDKDVLVSVTDQGNGIPVDELEHIFEKYYRGKKSDGNQDGFGLGLAICKNIINAHGGKLWAENSKKSGAIFYFTLPLTDKK